MLINYRNIILLILLYSISAFPKYSSYNDYELRRDGRNKYNKRYSHTCRNKKKRRIRKKKNKSHVKAGSYRKYRVRRGDSIYKISRKFKISVYKIKKYNRIKNDNIFIGQVLKIPLSKINGIVKKRRKRRKRKISGNTGYKKSNNFKFNWPLRRVYRCKRDGRKGVKSIGIIISGRRGAKVRASASGVVKKIGRMRGYGNYIIIKHKNRYMTVYANIGSIYVREGDKVSKKKIIGKIEPASNKLHFQIGKSGRSKNPLNFLPKRS